MTSEDQVRLDLVSLTAKCDKALADLKLVTEKRQVTLDELKIALTEIDHRGQRIVQLEGAIRDFAAITDEALFPRLDGPQTPISELKKKAKTYLLVARREGLF